MTENSTPQAPYAASGQGRRLKLFPASSVGPNAAIASQQTLLSRSRHAVRNDPWAGAAIDRHTANGIGCGIQRKQLWGTDELKVRVKDLYETWMPYADADGGLDLYGLQSLAWRSWREAGEVFARIRSRRASEGLPVPMQLQLIESEQCPISYTSTAPGTGNPIRCGVEFNLIGKRVAYWMYPTHPGDGIFTMGSQLRRVPAEQIIHLYKPLRPGQIRGVPFTSPVLVEMFNRARLDDAVMERQKIGNLFGGFFESEANSGANIIADLQTGVDADGVPLGGLEPGSMVELPPGMKAVFATPPSPGSDYNEFQRQRLMAIAAVHGVPFEVLTGDLRNVSDRALKLILNEFRRGLECDQWLYMIPQFCQPIFKAWMDAAVLGGMLEIPDYASVRDRACKSLWVPQGWPYSHPVQDVTATVAAIRAGLQSREEAVLSTGNDPEEIDRQNVEANARVDELGLSYDSDGRRSKTEPNQIVIEQDANQ